jgi:Uma2 family endonuclease
MSSVPRHLLSPQEYLDRERLADFRSEYYRGETFAMSGASWEHTVIKDNVARHAGNQLTNGRCRVATSDLRVKVSASGLYTYPDLVVVCDKPQFEDNMFDTLLNPRVVIEALSDSTEKYDRGDKFTHYQRVPSLNDRALSCCTNPMRKVSEGIPRLRVGLVQRNRPR